jgi:hypothetical protein
MAVLTVGSGQQFATLASAIAASNNGDTVQVQAGTYVDDFATITKNINLVGVGGMVHLVADENIPNGKAILVTDANVSIDHFEFSGAQVADGNGAGIRYEAGNLTITNSYFHNNQDGILTAPVTNGTLSIDHSEFAFNGAGDGFTHDIYAGTIGTFSLTNSYIHDAIVGHDVKSRAANNIITNNRILSNSSSDSYEIDLPNGGNATISNNVIQKGPNSQNPTMISYGEEGSLYGNASFSISNNVFVNQPAGSSRLAVNNYTGNVAQISNNQFYGLSSARVAAGANAQSGDTFLASLPTIDSTTHPWGGDSTLPPTVIEQNGSTDLGQVGANYFMYAHGTAIGPAIQNSGIPFTPGEFGGWMPIGAEATANGYEVAWKNGAADQYTVWNTDTTGNHVSNIGVVTGSSSTLESLETSFSQDLNRDGIIGVPGLSAGTTIESDGSTALVHSGNNYLMNPIAGGSGPELEYTGTPFTSGQFGGWTPIGAEATSTGFEVAWKNGTADQYTVWNTNSSGDYVSNALWIVAGSDPSLESFETIFNQDLNGDRAIGVPTGSIESSGSTALVQSGSNFFMKPVAGGSGAELEYSGTPFTSGEFGGWTPIGAEATSSGYEVAWKNGTADQYTVWNTDSSGNYVSNALGIVAGSDLSLQSLEPSFGQDVNRDGVIGVPVQHQFFG